MLHPPIRHLSTTGTIAGIDTDLTILTTLQLSNSGQNQKGEAARLPLFANLLCRLGSALIARMFRERLAPRERCVQLWFSSKPGGVMSPPELLELSPAGVLPIILNCKRRLDSEDCQESIWERRTQQQGAVWYCAVTRERSPKNLRHSPHNWIDRSGFRAGRHPRAISGRPPLVFSARLLPRGAQRQSRTTWLQRARAELLVSQSDHGINAHGPARRDPAGGERYER
jgi:hypothetical protein